MTEIPPIRLSSVETFLPPVGLIDSPERYTRVCQTVREHAPDYFWTAPAASSYDHHNPYCCGPRGLWIHTLMVATAYEELARSYVEAGRLTKTQADRGRAAVLLHDLWKFGSEYEEGDSSAGNHDLVAAEKAQEAGFHGQVCAAIATHMGPWYDGPPPSGDLQMLVHQADMAASTKNGTFGVYNPPKEIREQYPSLPRAEL